MHEYFLNVTDFLGLHEKSQYKNCTEGITDHVDSVVHKFSNHSYFLQITDHYHYQHDCSFHFQNANPQAFDLEIRALNPKKATVQKATPSKILRTAYDIC